MAIYLDSAATTKPKKEVIDAMIPYLTDDWYNPSSLYSPAVKVKKDIEMARATIAEFIGANNDEIYFTSGGSESNCLAIQGFVNNCISRGKKPIVITSVIEHKSILLCVENLHTDVHYVGVNNKGEVNIEQLEELLKQHYKQDGAEILVSIQYANNEIGVVQSIAEISRLAHKYGAILHTDAVQIVGKIPITVKEGIDLLSASAHKIGACKGCGFLYIRNGVKISPLIYGTQERNLRGGTENIPYIIGLAKAIEIINRNMVHNMINAFDIKEYFMELLHDKFDCKFNNYGLFDDGLFYDSISIPNIISVTFSQNITGESLVYMLDMSGIQVSTGSACNSHSIESSYVLKAIGLSDEEAQRTIRISFDSDITEEQINEFINELEKCIKLLSLEEGV